MGAIYWPALSALSLEDEIGYSIYQISVISGQRAETLIMSGFYPTILDHINLRNAISTYSGTTLPMGCVDALVR